MQLPFTSIHLFYRLRREKNFFDLAHILGPLRDPPGPGVRHALWTEGVKKILKIDRLMSLENGRFLRLLVLLFGHPAHHLRELKVSP